MRLCRLNRITNKFIHRKLSTSTSTPFIYDELFKSIGEDNTQYRKITSDYVSIKKLGDKEFLYVEPEALRLLSSTAMKDVSHLLRPAHLPQLSKYYTYINIYIHCYLYMLHTYYLVVICHTHLPHYIIVIVNFIMYR